MFTRDRHNRFRNRPTTRRSGRAARVNVEPLEGRALLSLTLVKDINTVPTFPTNLVGLDNGSVFFTTRAASGGTNLVVRTGSGTTVVREFPPPPNTQYAPTSAVSQLSPAGSIGPSSATTQ